MFTSDAELEFRKLLKEFAAATNEQYGGWAFAAGYLESMAVGMFGQLSKKDQKWEMARILRELERMKQPKEAA